MLSAAPIIGFIPTRNPQQARAFYEDVLALAFVSEDDFAVVLRSGTNMVRLVKTTDFTPARYTVLGWEVPDIKEAVQHLSAAGVQFQRFGFMEQDALGIWTTPAGNGVAWFLDPDGNVLSVSQHD